MSMSAALTRTHSQSKSVDSLLAGYRRMTATCKFVAISFCLLGSLGSSATEACEPLRFPELGTEIWASDGWLYVLEHGQITGGSYPDHLQMQLFSADTGTFDLASSSNANLATCQQCVTFYKDIGDIYFQKMFFQESGTLTLSEPPSGQSGDTLRIIFSQPLLVEVTVDPNTNVSTPVPGGDCYVGITDSVFFGGFDG